MTDTKKLKELAERARDKGDWYEASSVDAFPEFHVDQEFMVATSPDVVLWLIAEVERIKAENEALRGALQAVVDDPTWRSNDNTLWPKIIKAMDKGATQ